MHKEGGSLFMNKSELWMQRITLSCDDDEILNEMAAIHPKKISDEGMP